MDTKTDVGVSTEPVAQDIIWETPSRGRIVDGIWLERLAPLVENPGRWGRVMTCVGVTLAERHASNLRNRKVKVPAGDWEFTSRSNKEKNESYLYARFGGGEDVSGPVPVGPVELVERPE